MARKKKKTARKGRRKKKFRGNFMGSGKNHVPLKILEKRLDKLHRIVKSRGGRTA